MSNWITDRPIVPPAPDVKPKRWTVKYSSALHEWYLFDHGNNVGHIPGGAIDEHAIQRIVNIYNEVKP